VVSTGGAGTISLRQAWLGAKTPCCCTAHRAPVLPRGWDESDDALQQLTAAELECCGPIGPLFARSEGAAKAAATIYTLVGSCILQGIDPHEYLVDVLGRFLDHPVNRVGELTPRARREKQGHTK